MENKDKQIKLLNKALHDFEVFSKNQILYHIEQGNKRVNKAFYGSSNVTNDFHMRHNKELNFN